MFKKKDSSPPQPWPIRVLSRDYLVDGVVHPQAYWSEFSFLVGSARVQPVNPSIQPFFLETWVVRPEWETYALIPGDEAGIAAIGRFSMPGKVPIPVDLYAGPYLIQGVVLSLVNDIERVGTHHYWVNDVQITCLLPGTTIAPIRATMALVSSKCLQGMVRRG